MAGQAEIDVASLVTRNEQAILPEWVELQTKAGTLHTGRISEGELQSQSRNFLHLLRDALAQGGADASERSLRARQSHARRAFAVARACRVSRRAKPRHSSSRSSSRCSMRSIATRRCPQSRSPRRYGQRPPCSTNSACSRSEIFQKSREEVIVRQQREIAELSTPVVKLWDGILALPLIGTLDSQRTQVVMENLLQTIVDSEAEIAIIDITGVPTVDTLTAQHLLKTVAAARLMGADCLISGIRPQIAQTMVHLGVELNVISKATLADAFAVALRQTGRAVVKIKRVEADRPPTGRPAGRARDDGPHPYPQVRQCAARHHPGRHARPAGDGAGGRSDRPRSSRTMRAAC